MGLTRNKYHGQPEIYAGLPYTKSQEKLDQTYRDNNEGRGKWNPLFDKNDPRFAKARKEFEEAMKFKRNNKSRRKIRRRLKKRSFRSLEGGPYKRRKPNGEFPAPWKPPGWGRRLLATQPKAVGDVSETGGVTINYNSRYLKNKKKFYRFQTKWEWNQDATGQLQSPIGLQGFLETHQMCTGSEIGTIYNNVISINANPMGQFYADTYNELFVNECHKTTEIVNTNNLEVTVWLYTFVVRKDWSATSPSIHPVALGTQDAASVRTNTGLTQNVSQVTWTPFQSPQICRMHKIKKVQKFVLSPGHKIIYKTKCKVNRAFKEYELNNAAALNIKLQYFRNLTTTTLAILQGPIAHDSTTKSQITYASANCDVVEKWRYTGHWSMVTGKQVFATESLPTAFTSGTGAQEQQETVGTVVPTTA